MKICGMAFLYAIPCILFFRNPNQECITSVQIVFYEKIVDFISADGFTFSRLFAKKGICRLSRNPPYPSL